MIENRLYMLLAVFMLLSLTLSIADYDLGEVDPYYSCDSATAKDECLAKCKQDKAPTDCSLWYCSDETNSCWVVDGTASPSKTSPSVPSSGNISSIEVPLSENVVSNISTISTPEPSPDVEVLKERIATLEQQQAGTEAASSGIEQRIQNVESALSALQNDMSQLQANLQNVLNQQSNVKKEVSTVSTGLAGLQKTVDGTELDINKVEKKVDETASSTQFLKYGLFFLVLVVAGLAIGLYMTKARATAGESMDSSPPEASGIRPSSDIITFITRNIKRGKKYPEIKQLLLRAGWDGEDIDAAYKETANRNYQQYLQKSTGQSGTTASMTNNGKPPKHHTVYHRMDKQKVMYLTAFSVLIIVGLIFLLKGVTTGQAIHFQSPQELKEGVAESLAANLENNEFYPLVKFANLCVQVKDEENSVSYRIIKTPHGHAILSLEEQCDYSSKYDFAVKFESWESFDLLSNSLTCTNAQLLHMRKGLYILPSKFVQDGFQKTSDDYTSFCDALKLCAIEEQLKKLDIGC